MSAPPPSLKNRRAKIGRDWGPRLLVLNLVGYSLIALVSSAMDWDSTLASIPFRIFVLSLALYLILRLGPRSKWWRQARWPLLFAAIYLARLLWDAFGAGIPSAQEATVFFLATALIPGIAQGLASNYQASEQRTAWLLALTGGVICGCALLLKLLEGSTRMLDPSSTGGRLGFEALNSISLGHAASTTLIAVLCLMLYRLSGSARMILGTIAVIAALCLLSAGSRGPILSLGVASFLYALTTRRWRWLIAIALLVGITLLRTETSVIERFSTGGEDASSLARLVIQVNAIAQFLNSPILGSAYAELESLEYPHNIFIETAMALGAVGIILLLVVLGGTFGNMRREWRRRQILIPALFVQYLFGAQLSGSLWGNVMFWALVFILCRNTRRGAVDSQSRHRLAPPTIGATTVTSAPDPQS